MLVSLIVVLLIIDFLIFTVWDRYYLSLFVLVVSGLALWYFFPEVKQFVEQLSWQEVAKWVGIYLGVGISVAVVKWLLFYRKVGKKIGELWAKAMTNTDVANKTIPARREWFLNHVQSRGHEIYRRSVYFEKDSGVLATHANVIDELTPKANDYVDRISAWVIHWPFVVIGSLVEDILIEFFNRLAEMFTLMFTRIGRAIIGRSVKDL